MKKEDLEYGNVVETRNGDKYVYNICYGSGYLMCLNGRGSNPLDDYDQDLIIKFNFDHEFDIVKVYKDYTCKEVLWERKEIKLTDDEKAMKTENYLHSKQNQKRMKTVEFGILIIIAIFID